MKLVELFDAEELNEWGPFSKRSTANIKRRLMDVIKTSALDSHEKVSLAAQLDQISDNLSLTNFMIMLRNRYNLNFSVMR